MAVGTELSISLGPLGRTAATDLHAGHHGVVGAAFAYGQSKGLFLGVSLEGTVILSRPAVNRAFYGKDYSTHDLLQGQVWTPHLHWDMCAIKRLTTDTAHDQQQ